MLNVVILWFFKSIPCSKSKNCHLLERNFAQLGVIGKVKPMFRNRTCKSRSAFRMLFTFPALWRAELPAKPLHSSMALFANFLQRLAEALGTECIAELGIKLSAGFYTNVFKFRSWFSWWKTTWCIQWGSLTCKLGNLRSTKEVWILWEDGSFSKWKGQVPQHKTRLFWTWLSA